MEAINKKKMNKFIWIGAGVLLIAYVLLTSGVTAFAPITFADTTEAEESFAASESGWYRPFVSVIFEDTFSSGLYLFLEDDVAEKPTDWVMYGWLNDRWLPYLMKAESGATDYPPDAVNVLHILRYPGENADYIEGAADELVSMFEEENSLDDYYDYCADAMFEVADFDRYLAIVMVLGGLVCITVGVVLLLVAKTKKEDAVEEYEVLETFNPNGAPDAAVLGYDGETAADEQPVTIEEPDKVVAELDVTEEAEIEVSDEDDDDADEEIEDDE